MNLQDRKNNLIKILIKNQKCNDYSLASRENYRKLILKVLETNDESIIDTYTLIYK
jgi:hypothetical protein